MLPDRDLYKQLTKYMCKTMEDVLSQAWAQVKWEEDIAGRAKAQEKQDHKVSEPTARKGIRDGSVHVARHSHLSSSKPELVSVLRKMGQQVKLPQKTKAPDSFLNLSLWCDFHRDHGHKMEDCVALRIEVNEQLKKGHLREFLSQKAKIHLNKETSGKPTEFVHASPPRQDQEIHVISGCLEISGISHTAAKKSTWNAKHGLEAATPKRMLLGTNEISFTGKEKEKVLTPHQNAMVTSLTVAHCLVKTILVENGSSSNIIFQAAYQDLGLEESALTGRINPLIGFSGEGTRFATSRSSPI
ncbi:hypothetical protein F2Q70_00011781 [Brassica cretica]|uniref:Uncharacterized protein n=1 Tax=Brassica cretica TaxID=69181 RepID=A0A8S9M0K9_BRACR|nr:hypothetical protein F2Q70_00011781 [Brassica cretica]